MMRIDLLKKIATLAAQGIGGEKDNAQRKLEKFLRNHGHSLADLDSLLRENELMWVEFKFKDDYEKQLIGQCVCYLMQTMTIHNKYLKSSVEFKLPVSRASEIRSFVERVQEAYEDALSNFRKAFIHKQALYVKPTGDEVPNKKDEPETVSQEDMAAIRNMMRSIGHIQHRKTFD